MLFCEAAGERGVVQRPVHLPTMEWMPTGHAQSLDSPPLRSEEAATYAKVSRLMMSITGLTTRVGSCQAEANRPMTSEGTTPTGQGTPNSWRHQEAGNIGVIQVCQGQVPITASSSSGCACTWHPAGLDAKLLLPFANSPKYSPFTSLKYF